MTPTAVGLVLVEGEDADGAIMEQDGFDVPTRRGAAAISTADYVAGAMSRTRAMADGHRPHAIGVTWSGESELQVSLLLKSLTDAGFDNIVAVRSEEAGEALARGIGRMVGYQQTAVCLLEPDTVVVSMVDTHDGSVQTVSHREHNTDADLAPLTMRLEAALDMPVFSPPEADLALARGAALASAHNPEYTFDEFDRADDDDRARRRSLPLPYSAALGMLAVGVLTFVVSIAFAAGLRLTSNNGPDAATSEQRPTATQPASQPVAEAVPPVVTPPAVIAPPSPEATAEREFVPPLPAP